MDKPDRVEEGQWWHTQSRGLTRIAVGCVPAFEWFLDPTSSAEYLGSGEQPEPSEWMIETLAEHAYEIGRARLPPTWAGYPEDKRSNWRYCARRTLSGESEIMNEQLTDAMLSLYRILRSLGKW